MKIKEQKNLAKKIAKAELSLRDAQTPQEKKKFEEEIMKLCSHVKGIEDMCIIDDMVRDILKKDSD